MGVVFAFYILFVVLFVIDYKRGMLIYAPWMLFFGINVRFGPSAFNTILILTSFVFYYFGYRNKAKGKFPLKQVFLVYGALYIVTCIFPVISIQSIFRIVVQVLLVSYMYYYCLQTKKDVKFAVYSYALFAIVLCANGLLQPTLHINPLDEFLQSISDKEQSLFMDNAFVRMGQARFRSFIPHPITYGVVCVLLVILMIWYLSVQRLFRNSFLLSAVVLLFSGILICGSRTPILGLLPLCLMFFAKNPGSKNIKTVLALVLIAFLFYAGDYVLYSLDSLINAKLNDKVGGSNMHMRQEQLSIAFRLMIQHPIFGHGMGFNAFAVNHRMWGAESVWFPLMYQNGLVGVAAYLYFLWGIYKLAKNSAGKVFLLTLFFSWVIMRTATSLIGVNDSLFLTVFFIIYKFYNIENGPECCNPRLQR